MPISRRFAELLRGPVLFSASTLLVACGSAPQRPAPPVFNSESAFTIDLPDSDETGPAQGAWWQRSVTSRIANALEDVLAANPALRRADAETEAARAVWRQAEAELGPALNVDGSVGVQKVSGERRSTSRSIGIAGELPIDVSGALAAQRDAARATYDAVAADTAQLRSDLARDLLLAVIDGAEARQRRQLLDAQIALASRLLSLIELRFTQGLASSVDVLQQRDQLASLRQQLPATELDARRADNRVRQIGGLQKPPEPTLTMDDLPDINGRFAPIQPRDLLLRRADLRAANARLRAADARFATALAERWPQLSLSASGITRALSGDVSTIISAALDASLTLFDGGRKLAVADQRRAELVAAGEQLIDDWIAAVIDADDLLLAEASVRERIDLSQQRLDTAESLLKAAQRRFERGVSDYLPVLEALRSLQQQQRDHIALLAELARTRVRLHRALGEPVATEAA